MGLSLNIPDMIMDIVPALPMLAAALVFMIQARKGFALHGPGSPIYLPRAFEHVVAHIRKVQDEVSVPGRESEMAQIDSEVFSVLE